MPPIPPNTIFKSSSLAPRLRRELARALTVAWVGIADGSDSWGIEESAATWDEDGVGSGASLAMGLAVGRGCAEAISGDPADTIFKTGRSMLISAVDANGWSQYGHWKVTDF
ncbi:MAG: hypothetical protein GY768_08875 [Planctomycetaceae bacterium]|nr:hypothetical protein [Planctomycetaceae bacterium]